MNEMEFITNPDCHVVALMMMPMVGIIFNCLEMIRGHLEGYSGKSDF